MASTTTVADLREMNAEDLSAALRESKGELFNLRFQSATGQLENSSRLRTVRHDIARIYTIMRERELGIISTDDDAGTQDEVGTQDGAGTQGAAQ